MDCRLWTGEGCWLISALGLVKRISVEGRERPWGSRDWHTPGGFELPDVECGGHGDQ